MKKFTKILSMVLLIAMCMSMFAISASADAVHVKQTCDTPALDGSITYSVSDNAGAGIASVTWNMNNGDSYDATGFWSQSGSTLTVDGTNWADVSSVTIKFNNGLSVTVDCVKNAAGYDENGSTQPDPTPAPETHEHDWQYVRAVEPTCSEVGYAEHAKCACGALRQYGVDIASKDALAIGVVDHDYVNGTCRFCGVADPAAIADPEIVATNGKTTYVYDSKSSNDFTYTLKNYSDWELTEVYIGGEVLYYNEYDFGTRTGRITLKNRAVGALLGSAPSAEVTFVVQAKADPSIVYSVSGFYFTNKENTTVEDGLKTEGLSTSSYVQGSGKTVFFRTNINDTSKVKLYSYSTGRDCTPTFEPVEVYYDMYTYTFTQAFLNSLATGNYDVRIYYGESNGQFISVGNLYVSKSNTTAGMENALYYTNSTLSDNHGFRYISGSEVPRLFCDLFLVKGARLQVSTNGGKSWSDVNVNNYYVEPNRKGTDTPHAWIGSAYLDSLDAGNIYYFRVMVPASTLHTGYDVYSNTISLTTGPTLKAVDTAKHVINSTKNLRFTSSEKVAKVYVGNVQLTDENDFAVSNDGKTVTLSSSFLNKRTAGSTYTIKVLTTTGEYASTTFQILTTAQASASPRTGDTSNIGLWTAVLMLSAGAAVAVLPRLKKEQ